MAIQISSFIETGLILSRIKLADEQVDKTAIISSSKTLRARTADNEYMTKHICH
jgi:hypothetical protein